MGELVPIDYMITMLSIGLVVVLTLLSKDCKRVALAIIISLIGARLSSYYYTPHYHTAAMLISMALLIKQTGLIKIISLLYGVRVLISIVTALYAKESMPLSFLASEAFLWIQIALWLGVIKNDWGSGHVANNHISSYPTDSNRALSERFAVPMDKHIKQD